MPPNFATEGIIIVGGGSGVCIDDPQLISGFFHRTDIKVSDGSKLRRNNVARWREGEDAEAILPDDCSSIIQQFSSAAVVATYVGCRDRFVPEKASIARKTIQRDSIGFAVLEIFGIFLKRFFR